MELGKIEYSRAIGRLVCNTVIIPAQPGRQCQRRSYLPFILEVGHVEVAAQAMAAPGRDVVDVGERSLGQRVVVTERQIVIRGLSLVQPDATIFHPQLESMFPSCPDQVIDQAVGGTDLDVGTVIVEAYEIISAHRIRQSAGLRVMEGRAIDIELHFIEESWTEGVLQRQKIVRRMVDGL